MDRKVVILYFHPLHQPVVDTGVLLLLVAVVAPVVVLVPARVLSPVEPEQADKETTVEVTGLVEQYKTRAAAAAALAQPELTALVMLLSVVREALELHRLYRVPRLLTLAAAAALVTLALVVWEVQVAAVRVDVT